MRQKIKIIENKKVTFTLLCGIPNLVKVYSREGSLKPWLCIKGKFFTLQDEFDNLVFKFINLKYQSKEEQSKIQNEFEKLCKVYL